MVKKTENIQSTSSLYKQGFRYKTYDSEQTVVRDGRAYREVHLTDRDPNQPAGKLQRLGRAALGILAFPANISSKFREKTWGVATKGYQEVKYLEGGDDILTERRKKVDDISSFQEADKQSDLEKEFGYDPIDRKSIIQYLKRDDIRAKLIKDDCGNYYLPENKHPQRSAFLFIPGGNFEKAISIKLSNSRTGEVVKGSEFSKMMYIYGSQYEDMQKGMGVEADKIIHQLFPDKTSDKKLKDKVLESMRIAVISPEWEHTRIYSGHLRDKRDIFGKFLCEDPHQGRRIEWEDSTKKHVSELCKKQPDNKLETKQAFPYPPPQSSSLI
ncbi:MAG: hypothetical protein R3E91_02685 [Chlamydiales bacterium]